MQVVSVQRMEECFQPNSDTLERLHQQAKAVNAEMTIYFNDSPAITAAVHAVKEGAVNIVMGFPRENSAHFVEDVHLLAPEVPISMVDGDDKIYQMIPPHPRRYGAEKGGNGVNFSYSNNRGKRSFTRFPLLLYGRFSSKGHLPLECGEKDLVARWLAYLPPVHSFPGIVPWQSRQHHPIFYAGI